MRDASETRSAVGFRQPRRHAASPRAAAGSRWRSPSPCSESGCGLKGPLTLPEEARNVVIRPGPGGEAAPAATPLPAPRPKLSLCRQSCRPTRAATHVT